MMNRYIKYIAIGATALIFSACGGKGNLGIDNQSIPKCNSDMRDNSNALKIDKNAKIVALTKDTKVRVWHYANGDKLVCCLSGEAVIKGE